jgi:hypothetical protein
MRALWVVMTVALGLIACSDEPYTPEPDSAIGNEAPPDAPQRPFCEDIGCTWWYGVPEVDPATGQELQEMQHFCGTNGGQAVQCQCRSTGEQAAPQCRF